MKTTKTDILKLVIIWGLALIVCACAHGSRRYDEQHSGNAEGSWVQRNTIPPTTGAF